MTLEGWKNWFKIHDNMSTPLPYKMRNGKLKCTLNHIEGNRIICAE